MDMTITFDVGHGALIIIIVMLIAKQMVSAWLVSRERDSLQNKLLADHGTLDNYVTGKLALDGAVDKDIVEEEIERRLDEEYERDVVQI